MNFLLKQKVIRLFYFAAILGISGCSDCYLLRYEELNHYSIKNSANDFLMVMKPMQLNVDNQIVPEFYNPISF